MREEIGDKMGDQFLEIYERDRELCIEFSDLLKVNEEISE